MKKILFDNNVSYDHVDISTLKPLDLSLLKNSLKKTKKLLIVDTISHPICSIGSEILSQIFLDKEIKLKKKSYSNIFTRYPNSNKFFLYKRFLCRQKGNI